MKRGYLFSRGPFGRVKPNDMLKLYFDQAGLNTDRDKYATAQLMYNLQDARLLEKMVAIYPMNGGTASAHSLNLVDIAKYKLSFFGGWTHSATGAKPNGVNAYADTGLVHGNVVFRQNQNSANKHLSYYSRTASASTGTMIGLNDGGGVIDWLNVNPIVSTLSGRGLLAGSSVSTGLFAVSIVVVDATTPAILYHDGATLDMAPGFSPGGDSTDTYYIAASHHLGVAAFFSECECAFASIGLGMDITELKALDKIVQQYQTTKERAI